ncbi:MAG: hypothetical protein WCK35_07730 [Chloroflexota bacterium]
MNKNLAQSIIPSTGGVLHELTLRTKLILRLLADKRVSPWAKLVPIAGLIYWLSPIDLIFGIPGIDAIDDFAVLWFVQYAFIEFCPTDVVSEITMRLTSNNSVVDKFETRRDDIIDGEVTNLTEQPEQ